MQIRNASQRVVHLNLKPAGFEQYVGTLPDGSVRYLGGSGFVSIEPSMSVTLPNAPDARGVTIATLLAGLLKPLVDSGDLVVT